MNFSTIEGYEPIKKQLVSGIQQQRVGHAQLFWGPQGNAGLALALSSITYLSCQYRRNDDACGQCASCIKMKKWEHPDVKFIFPTGATHKGDYTTQNTQLNTFRQFLKVSPYGNEDDWSHYLNNKQKSFTITKGAVNALKKELSFKPVESTYRFILIWLPEYLHKAAANALLKIIEAPPVDTLFLLVSTQYERILGTIRSRTQQLYIPPFTDEGITKVLVQKYKLNQVECERIALLSAGDLNKATQLATQDISTYFDSFKHWMRACYTRNFIQLTAQAKLFQSLPVRTQKSTLAYILHMLRAVLLRHIGTPITLSRVSTEESLFIHNLSQTTTYTQLKEWIKWLVAAHYHLDRQANPRIVHLNTSLNVVRSFHPNLI